MENQFTVAIVGGTGNLGGALALRLGAPGVKIIIGSRDAEKAKKVVETLKPSLHGGEIEGMANQAAVKGADFVVVAVPDRKSTRLNSSHIQKSRMPSSA